MYCENACLGVDCALADLKVMNEKLSAMVIEQVNGSQELVMMNTFARESNEYRYKKCLQERISEIKSWRWVLKDLTKRLEESISALQHEHNALRVVVQRIEKEIDNHSREYSRPGALNPLCDQVEEAIMEVKVVKDPSFNYHETHESSRDCLDLDLSEAMAMASNKLFLQEFKFLNNQKKRFEKMIPELDKQTAMLQKTKNRIVADVLDKEQTISIEEHNSIEQNIANVKDWKKKRKKYLCVIN